MGLEVELNRIDSLSHAIECASKLGADSKGFGVFRGQANVDWKLEPSLFRRALWSRNEHRMIRDVISAHPQEFKDDRSMLDQLVRLQHYGLPTRLLDVTHNFLVALFFACKDSEDGKSEGDGAVFYIQGPIARQKYYDSDTVSVVANLANLTGLRKARIAMKRSPSQTVLSTEGKEISVDYDQLAQFVRQEKPYFKDRIKHDDLMSSYLVLPKKNNRRIISQSGAFIICGLGAQYGEGELDEFRLSYFTIPKIKKAELRRDLETIGVSEELLFPEIETLSRAVARRYQRGR